MCCESENITVPAIDMSELGFADANGVLQHRLKDRSKLARRTANDPEYFRGRYLLLKRLAQLAS